MPLDLEKIFELEFFSLCPWTWKIFLEVKVFHHAPGLRNFFESIFSTMLLDLDRMPMDLEFFYENFFTMPQAPGLRKNN